MSKETKELARLITKRLSETEAGRETDPDPAASGGYGKLAIIDGKLVMIKPHHGGKWPTITPGKGNLVHVLHRGQPLTKTVVVEDTGDIELVPTRRPAHSSYEIVVSKNKMEVWLATDFVTGHVYQVVDSDYTDDLIVEAGILKEQKPAPIELDLVYQEVDRMGIKAPLHHGEIIRACRSLKSGRALIAIGTPAQSSVDARIELVRPKAKTSVPHPGQERINLLEHGEIASVEPGEVLTRPSRANPGQTFLESQLDLAHLGVSLF